jgi:hypothetical protein
MCKKMCKFLLGKPACAAHPWVTKVRDRDYRLQRFLPEENEPFGSCTGVRMSCYSGYKDQIRLHIRDNFAHESNARCVTRPRRIAHEPVPMVTGFAQGEPYAMGEARLRGMLGLL